MKFVFQDSFNIAKFKKIDYEILEIRLKCNLAYFITLL
jgi:hypothetical protein